MSRTSISVIVIGLNEAANLRRCFDSVHRALTRVRDIVASSELVFVDAGSSDDSTAIASAAVDRLIVFEGTASAAAARQAGTRSAVGELFLFLDGDMELEPDWLGIALEHLHADERVAGITGMRCDRAAGSETIVQENVYDVRSLRRAQHFGGAVLLRRAVLEKAGGYDPGMPNAEEPDLYARILSAGYPVLELPVPFITHYLKRPPGARQRIARAWDTRGFWRSFGNALRKGYLSGFVRVYPRFFIVSAIHLLAIVAMLVAGWRAGLLMEAAALILFAIRGRTRELLQTVMRWLSLITYAPWLFARRAAPVAAWREVPTRARAGAGPTADERRG
ncbi:MAG: glycosyltransferase family 2 protein [Longimicrobiales bacterium]